MRPALICFLIIFLSHGALANDADNAEVLYRGCRVLPDFAAGKTNDQSLEVGLCIGTVKSVYTQLNKLHRNYYLGVFPNLIYPIKDYSTASRYISNILLIGPNVCFPERITVGVLAAIVERYGQQKPEKLSESGYEFVVDAVANTYSCSPENR